MVNEHPIPFNGDEVRAILAGRKTQTRRPVKPQPVEDTVTWGCVGGQGFGFIFGNSHTITRSPFGKPPGDVLWVQSPYRVSYDAAMNLANWHGPQGCGMWAQTHGVPLRNDGKPMQLGNKPSWQMPYWLSAEAWPLLPVKRVWFERVQDISEDDCWAEAVNTYGHTRLTHSQLRCGFAVGWDSIYAKRGLGWDTNPWVWACEFKMITPNAENNT